MEEIQQRQQQDESGHGLSIGVDCRFSKPGYTATHGMTTAMDLDSGKILHSVLRAKSDIDATSSPDLETKGTMDVLGALIQPFDEEWDQTLDLVKKQMAPPAAANDEDSPDFSIPAPASDKPPVPLRIDVLVTDENQAVAKKVKETYGDRLKHQSDPWHLKKAIMKRIRAAASKKRNELLAPWLISIRNWIWTAMKESNGDGELLVELFRSMAYHLRGEHSWEDDATYNQFKKCPHPDVSGTNFAYLSADFDAYRALLEILEDKKLHQRLRRCSSRLETTSLIESFHSLICKYLPKDLSFTDLVIIALQRMGILDWNENVGRDVQRDEFGGERLTFDHPASAGDWRARRMRVDRTYDWRKRIMKNLSTFAIGRWEAGNIISLDSKLKYRMRIHMPLVSMYEPLNRDETALNLYRNN